MNHKLESTVEPQSGIPWQLKAFGIILGALIVLSLSGCNGEAPEAPVMSRQEREARAIELQLEAQPRISIDERERNRRLREAWDSLDGYQGSLP